MTDPDRGLLAVLSVPAGHPYVANSIAVPGEVDDGLLVLPDVLPPGRPGGQWWPPVALDPATLERWLEQGWGEHAQSIDLVHVHFGFEGVDPADLQACAQLLRDHGVPLVLTVHDLRNPHLADDDGYAARLDLLVGAADALITLTGAAADQIQQRWGRPATVIAHPHVAPLRRIVESGPRRAGDALRVLLPLKSLRANTLTAGQVHQVVEVVRASGCELEVSIHPEALDPAFLRHDPQLAELLVRLGQGDESGAGSAQLRVHQRLDDEAFLDELQAPDLVILPYRFGTHSGVLEACRDVHTVALVPEVGCYDSQAPSITYQPHDIAGTLPAGLAAMRGQGGTTAPPGWFVDRQGRHEQALQVRRAHRRVYAALTAGASA